MPSDYSRKSVYCEEGTMQTGKWVPPLRQKVQIKHYYSSWEVRGSGWKRAELGGINITAQESKGKLLYKSVQPM